jgi:hypothetical protein
MTPTIEVSNGGDDRASAAPASHRSKHPDDADEAIVTQTYALRCDDFFASFGVVTDRHR